MYQTINMIRILVTNAVFGFIAFCGETCDIQKMAVALAIVVGVSIISNIILVVITRILYFDRKISRKEVVPPFWKL